MRTATRNRIGLLVLVAIAAALVIFLLARLLGSKPADPHEGQVYIYDGFDWIWMTPLEGVEANPWTETDFFFLNGSPIYKGEDYQVLRGVDVSEHQYGIDWRQVVAADVDFAFIRVGRRGYSEGGLFEDEYFRANIEGALQNSLQVGVYFFSQAINVQEAIEEANFVIALLKDYEVALPVVFDWEKIEGVDSARTNGLSSTTLTDCAVAFCETVKSAGYTPAVYFNRHLGYYGFDLTRLTEYEFWFALPEAAYPSFYYAVDAWQYSFTESVPGIDTEADMNLLFIPQAAGSGEETAG